MESSIRMYKLNVKSNSIHRQTDIDVRSKSWVKEVVDDELEHVLCKRINEIRDRHLMKLVYRCNMVNFVEGKRQDLWEVLSGTLWLSSEQQTGNRFSKLFHPVENRETFMLHQLCWPCANIRLKIQEGDEVNERILRSCDHRMPHYRHWTNFDDFSVGWTFEAQNSFCRLMVAGWLLCERPRPF